MALKRILVGVCLVVIGLFSAYALFWLSSVPGYQMNSAILGFDGRPLFFDLGPIQVVSGLLGIRLIGRINAEGRTAEAMIADEAVSRGLGCSYAFLAGCVLLGMLDLLIRSHLYIGPSVSWMWVIPVTLAMSIATTSILISRICLIHRE